ncbi:hypothetical protein CYY_006784 [Polysphondylium violaceum]|uniref:Uncharacterized protein n=1 Tax=Polysphondylium violaceum TaxID=133409 RepID=A0A8J4PPM4_9MYCE|nr:hypothetical protein CYY_006784 [Polysphondylium violaceum]
MKVLIVLFLLVIINYSSSVFGATCTQNSDCSTGVCRNRLLLFSGLGLNTNNNRILVMGNSPVAPAPIIASVPTSGGSIKGEYQILSNTATRTAHGIFKYLPSSQLLFTINSQTSAPYFVGPYYQNGTLVDVWETNDMSIEIDFDETNQETLLCTTGISLYNSIPITTGSSSSPVYKNVKCQGLGRVGTTLYGSKSSTTGSDFFSGDVGCNNCEESQLNPLFSETFQVSDLAVTSTNIYYSSVWSDGVNEVKGIFEVPINGDLTQKRVLSSDSVEKILVSNGVIYYISNGKLKSVTISSATVSTLYENTGTYQGECA